MIFLLGKTQIDYLEHIRSKARFSPFVRLILDAFSKAGIDIQPFYLFHEGVFGQNFVHQEDVFNKYSLGFLQEEEMGEIAAIKWRNINELELKLRLAEGKKCFGARYCGELAAFTWYNTKECDYKGCRFTLKDNEAYLFDAYTFFPYRGKGLAPYIRFELYKVLAKSGRSTLYSISNRFNISAINFKKKLRARIVGSGICVELFKIWRFNLKKLKMSDIS
ncbi:MAG: hypothetical protein MUP22_08815 [Desulfobacterales bacterium]|nr:hypothetical protein [Desulfobacterales bacterium]